MSGRSYPAPVQRLDVSAYTVPTDLPESDGTLKWDKTTLVLVNVTAGGKTGLGYTYADSATATLIHAQLAPLVAGTDPMAPNATYTRIGNRFVISGARESVRWRSPP